MNLKVRRTSIKGWFWLSWNLSKVCSSGIVGHSTHTVRASPATTIWYHSLLHYNANITLFLSFIPNFALCRIIWSLGCTHKVILIIVREGRSPECRTWSQVKKHILISPLISWNSVMAVILMGWLLTQIQPEVKNNWSKSNPMWLLTQSIKPKPSQASCL